jgi:hypothetical protein
MTIDGSVAVMRAITALRAGSPGVMARYPPRSAVAASRVSRRSPALRVALSGPWQEKQFAERMGRISCVKSTGGAVRLAFAAGGFPARTVAAVESRTAKGDKNAANNTMRRNGDTRSPNFSARYTIAPSSVGITMRHLSAVIEVSLTRLCVASFLQSVIPLSLAVSYAEAAVPSGGVSPTRTPRIGTNRVRSAFLTSEDIEHDSTGNNWYGASSARTTNRSRIVASRKFCVIISRFQIQVETLC